MTSHAEQLAILPPFIAGGQEPWMDSSLCAQSDPELFYPEKGQSANAAKRVCSQCPVRQECLDWAVDAGEDHGVWGGLSRKERHAYAKRLGAPHSARRFPVPTDYEIERARAQYATAPDADQGKE